MCAQSADKQRLPFTTAEVVAAYEVCRRHKRNKPSTVAFEQNAMRELCAIRRELNTRTYQPRPSRCFVVLKPKPREMWAADFRDRVVHHIMHRRIKHLFVPSFHVGSSACQPGRGPLYASRYLEKKLRQTTQNWQLDAYFLQMDLHNFFYSINKSILWAILSKKITEPNARWLTHTVLFHDPRNNYITSGPVKRWALVPEHKILFNVPDGMGLPPGNLPSQFFANVKLNELDQFCAHKIKPKGYVRYVDDFVLIDTSPAKLAAARDAITEFLWADLLLSPNPTKTHLDHIKNGINFVGGVIKPWRTTPRKRVVNNAWAELKKDSPSAASITSHLATLANAKSWHHRQALCRRAYQRGFTVFGSFKKVQQTRSRAGHQP